MGVSGYDYRARKRRRLHACRDIGRVAKNVGFVASASIYHHCTGMNPDSCRQLGISMYPLDGSTLECYLPPYRVPKRGLGERWTVRIPPAFAECTAFLCEEKKAAARGTAFFVEWEEPDRIWVYLVTARHNLEEGLARDMYVRVNISPTASSSVTVDDVRTSKDDWFKHDTADVAVLPSPIDRQRYPIMQIPMDLAIDRRYKFDVAVLDGRGNPVLEPVLRQNFPDGISVEVGDELFSPGLFVQSAGKNRNLPVVRFGNIARMPGDEMITLSTQARGDISIRAYLIETHSWGGFSGSPMFWHYEYNLQVPLNVQRWFAPPQSRLALPTHQPPYERVDVMYNRGWAIALLGLVSGHYDIPTKARNEDVETMLNAGIAVVTPAENIRELLMSDELAEDRRRRKEQDKEPTATADYATDRAKLQILPNTGTAIPVSTRDDFLKDLGKATRRKKSSE
jgi:hypothetical protein